MLRCVPTICVVLLATACTSAPPSSPSAPQASSSPVQAVPCPSLPLMTFHAPTTVEAAEDWLAGTLTPDQAAKYDRPDTVAQIRRNNAAAHGDDGKSGVCSSH